MTTFHLKIDLLGGVPLEERGFEAGVRSDGPSRLSVRSKFSYQNYLFYLAGRCTCFTSREQLQEWLCRFSPESIGAWAKGIDGDLRILVFDTRGHQAYLISDRNGASRTYYFCQDGSVLASNSLLELIQLMKSPRLSSFAAYQELTLLYVSDPCCPVEGVQATMPGQIVTLRPSGFVASSYYSPVTLDSRYLESEQECVAALDSAYRRVFAKRLTPGRTPCVLLSGGIDSLTMLKYVKERCTGPVLTLTFSFKNLYPNELEPARTAARYFGSDHQELVIDPDRALELYACSLAKADSPNPASMVAQAEKTYLEQRGCPVDLFTGEDTRLHTPSFDTPEEIGILLNRNPGTARGRRAVASALSGLFGRYPFKGSLNNYLRHWASQLTPRPDFRAYIAETLTQFHLPETDGHRAGEHHARLLATLPEFGPDEDLQVIYKKYVSFEYRTQYTDDMYCGVSSLTGPLTELHHPFYDWEAVEASNCIPYHLAMRGTLTLRSGSKMPFVRKRIARAVVGDSVPKELLFRAKKTCPALHVIFNSALGNFVSLLLERWGPPLIESVDQEVRAIIKATISAYSSHPTFQLNQDEHLLSSILGVCHLATLNRACWNGSVRLADELASLRDEAAREAGSAHAA